MKCTKATASPSFTYAFDLILRTASSSIITVRRQSLDRTTGRSVPTHRPAGGSAGGPVGWWNFQC